MLSHEYEGRELDLPYAKDTLANVHYLWRRPVHLKTTMDDKKMLLSYDGERYEEKRM
jgi:stage V sporulation protein R